MYGILHVYLIVGWLSHVNSETINSIKNERSSTSSCSSSCQLPSCFCGDTIPGNLHPDEAPQFVIISFDDAVNDLNKDFYERLFSEDRVNPNGCPITATFFVSHEWTDYSQVNHLYSQGHEISSHTVTHSHPTGFSEHRWTQEISGIRQNCNIPPCPEAPHHGIWEVPMTTMLDDRGGKCAMFDACSYEENVEKIQRQLTRNFLRHYTADNKPPFPMSYHAAWFAARPHREEAFFKFIDSILDLPDVYLVTYQDLLRWVKSPIPMTKFFNMHATTCRRRSKTRGCKKRVCDFGDRTLVSCAQCPTKYPWL